MRILRPATKWGRVTLWLGILCLLLWTADSLRSKRGRVGGIYHPGVRLLLPSSWSSAGVTAPCCGGCAID